MLPEFCLSEDGEKLVLHRFHGEIPVKGGKEDTKKIAYVDLETTGLNPMRDEIIEIGILKFDLGLQSGKIVHIDGEYQSLQQPSGPLPAVITRITGLTDADLADQAIKWPEIETIFQDCDLIVAHNAQFDRGFLERKLPGLKDKIFACSVSQVPWTEHHYGCRKLEHLCWEHGFFFLAHRAILDVKAAVYLLQMNSPAGKTWFQFLLDQAFKHSMVIQASQAAYETKDKLKNAGFRWNNTMRVWEKKIEENELDSTQAWLEKEVYLGKSKAQVQKISASDRFRSPQN